MGYLPPEIATTTDESLPLDAKPIDGKLINNLSDAQSWQAFHAERVVGIEKMGDLPPEALESARYAKDKFETYLFESGYTAEKGAPVESQTSEAVLNFIKTAFRGIMQALLPDRAYAYVFGTEDFESCSSLPCSFSSTSSWGSVTPSLDATSKVNGVDSLREVVTGEGSGALKRVDINDDEVWVQFKVFIPSDIAWGASGFYSLLLLEDSSDNMLFWFNLENWGNARLTFDGNNLPWTDSGVNLTKGAVNTIEVRFKKGSSTGDVDIWVNNTTQGSPNYNGSGSMNTGANDVDDILVGVTYAPENGISTTYYDDVVVDTGFIGTLVPPNSAPSVPSALLVEGQTNPTDITDNTPEFSAIYNDLDTGDIATKYQIQLATSSGFTTIYWDSGSTTLASSTSQGNRIADISYGGSTLASSTTYYWRIKFWDDSSAEGSWSTSTATFNLASSSSSGTSSMSYMLYEDSVASGWSSQSWSTTLNPSNTSPVYAGSHSLRAIYSGAWSGMSYHHNGFNSSPYDSLRLKVNVGTSTSVDLYAYFTNASGTAIEVVDLQEYVGSAYSANTWYSLEIPLVDFEFEDYNAATNFNIEASQASIVYYDNIEFVGSTTTEGEVEPEPGPEYATTTYSYTDYGLLESVTYPSGMEVEYSYNIAGLPEGVEVNNEPHVTAIVYDHRGVVTDISYATNATTSFTYDVEQGYRLMAKDTVKNGITLEDIEYTYDAQGNILTIVDTGTIVPQSTVYTYDDLNRLASSDVTVASTTYSDDYSYDAIGRISSHNGTGYNYTNNRHPHAPTSFGSSTYAYDINGNLASSTEAGITSLYTYDPLDRLSAISAGGTTTATYWYGDGRDRIAKSADGHTTLYINPLAEYTRNGFNDAVMIEGTRISTIDEVTTRWHVKDHLRSTAITVGEDDTLYEAIRYTPYGAERDRVGGYRSSHTYTDQVSDDESDLLYYNARYYNPTLKTFTSADPVAMYTPEQVIATPQLLNSYSYVANNPIVYNDPGGEYLDVAIDLGFTAYSVYRLGHAVLTGGDVKGESINLALDAGGLLVPGVVGLGTVNRASQAALKVENAGGAVAVTKEAVDETYSVYQGFDRTTGEIKYVGITKRDPQIRFTEHKNSGDLNRSNLRYEKMPSAANLSRNDARVIEQAVINNKGLSKNGGPLVNRINSISPAKQVAALNSASNSARAASDAIAAGNYDAAYRYLGQVSNSLKNVR